MDGLEWKKRLKGIISKYKFAIMILCAGILLMTMPDLPGDKNSIEVQQNQTREHELSDELASILSKIDGVGRVEVMLTEAAAAETVYQTDDDISQSEDAESGRRKTVVISVGSDEQGLVRTITPPVYLGAIVVCQGGENPRIQLAVVQAVSSVTGIGSDRIAVLKMK